MQVEPLPIHYACQVTSGKAYSVAFSVFSNLIVVPYNIGVESPGLPCVFLSVPQRRICFDILKVSLKLQTCRLAAIEHKWQIQ